MCLAIPSKIIVKNGFEATVDIYGARRKVNLMLLPEDASVGEYVLVHAGFAIQKIDDAAAKDAIGLIDEILKTLEQEDA
ncbi:MAG: HypC/HybG/HupF family hydrogenase formation chaperone [Nitrospiraceae bacterium]|nr:HypC/HybG/HupF family hydrogenase formation chaperone [Nitrospiraceae bacterium]